MAKKKNYRIPAARTDEILSAATTTKIVTPADLAMMAHDENVAAAQRAGSSIHALRRAKEAYFARKLKEKNAARSAADSSLSGEVHISQGQLPYAGEGSVTNTKLTVSQMQRLRALVAERIERRREALKVWRAMPTQQEFQNCTSKERVVYGSNRSGKTTVSAVEVALIVTGLHPKLSGTKLPKTNGIACCVGYDYSHVGRVLYRKLFKPGAFRVIRDAETGLYRPYEPDGQDKGTPRSHSEAAPPLIPKRYIAPGGVNWYRRKEGIPKSIKLTTGWEIRFYSSEGEPPQGDAVHLFWLDEEMINEAWYTESSRGLMDEGGFFIWSATPHVGGDALIDLHERAEKYRMDPNAVTREFLLLIFDNIHAAQADKQDFIDKLKDNPEAYRTRILGEFAAKAFKVYSEFSMEAHGFDMASLPGGKIPDDWCRFAAIDPGHQVTAVLFLAVPPPGKYSYKWYIYDELYLEKCSPTRFAEAFEIKTRGHSFEALIIDMRAGRVTTMGGEKPVEQIYREALSKVKARRNIPTENNPSGRPARESDKFDVVNCWDRVKRQMFVAGADNPKAGISSVKEALQVQLSSGMSQVVFARGRLPNTEYEMAHYHHKRIKGKLTDELSKKDDHLMDCLRYLVCARPEWQRPKRVVRPATAAMKRLKAKQARLDSAQSNSVNLGPRSSRTLMQS